MIFFLLSSHSRDGSPPLKKRRRERETDAFSKIGGEARRHTHVVPQVPGGQKEKKGIAFYFLCPPLFFVCVERKRKVLPRLGKIKQEILFRVRICMPRVSCPTDWKINPRGDPFFSGK